MPSSFAALNWGPLPRNMTLRPAAAHLTTARREAIRPLKSAEGNLLAGRGHPMAASQMVIFLKGCHQRDQLTLGATREKNAPCCGTCLHLAAGSRRSPGRWVRTCGAERSSELSVLLYTTNAGAAAPSARYAPGRASTRRARSRGAAVRRGGAAAPPHPHLPPLARRGDMRDARASARASEAGLVPVGVLWHPAASTTPSGS